MTVICERPLVLPVLRLLIKRLHFIDQRSVRYQGSRRSFNQSARQRRRFFRAVILSHSFCCFFLTLSLLRLWVVLTLCLSSIHSEKITSLQTHSGKNVLWYTFFKYTHTYTRIHTHADTQTRRARFTHFVSTVFPLARIRTYFFPINIIHVVTTLQFIFLFILTQHSVITP